MHSSLTLIRMLYEFYTNQNAKKPGSVHATYILTGKQRGSEQNNGTNRANVRDGEDTMMASSPPYMSSIPSSMPEAEEPVEMSVPKTSIVLVREEELDKTKAEFEDVTSMHIYSLEPGPIDNLNILSVCNHEIATEHASEDPLEQWRTYGSIHNPYVKKRVAKFAPAPPSAAAKVPPKPAAKPSAAAQPKEKEATAARRGSVPGDNTSERSTPQPTVVAPKTVKKTDSKVNLKRSTSDIFKSFAKSKPPKAKEADKSKESTPAPPEDGMLDVWLRCYC
jgi:DNA polymerase delta subunit 3